MKRLLSAILLIFTLAEIQGQDAAGRLVWEYYSNREYDKAAPLFRKMYEENQIKTYLDYYVNCLIQTEQYEAAITALKKAIRTTRDITLYIDLGFVYESMGDLKKAEENYQEPLKEFPQTPAGIVNLGNAYSQYVKPYYAETVYELGRKVTGNPNAFRMEMAQVYFVMRKFPAMVDEYLAHILQEPQYLPSVQALIQAALNYDVDQTLLEITREKTLANIQQLPGIPVYYELLVWILTQEKNFTEAVEQSIALDRRTRGNGDKVVQIARISSDAGAFNAALSAYGYLIEKGPETNPPTANSRNIQGQSSYRIARVESLLIRSASLQEQVDNSRDAWLTLCGEIEKTIGEFGKSAEVSQLYIEWARIQAEELSDFSVGLQILEEALAIPGNYPGFRTDCLLLKGNILLSSGDPWEASFIFAIVDMENPDNPSGSEARLRRARISWFTGDFTLAMAQLDVLKGSTSKPVANDAFELSLLIRENTSDTDSTQSALISLSEIDYLMFRHEWSSALTKADSLLTRLERDAPSRDDALYFKARILYNLNDRDSYRDVLRQLVEEHRYDYWGHKAVYELACMYQDELKDFPKASGLFEEFIRDFPTSFYFLDSRDRLKALRSKEDN